MLLFYQINHHYWSFLFDFKDNSNTQMIENQEELRSALQMNREQKELIKQLQKDQTSGLDGASHDKDELLTQVSCSNQENLN